MSNRTMSKYGLCRVDPCDRFSFVLVYTFFIHIAMQAFFIFMVIKYSGRTTASEIQFVKDNWFFFALGCFYTAYTFLQQCISRRCTKFISNTSVVIGGTEKNPQVVTAYKGWGWVGLRTVLCLVMNFLIQLIFGSLKVLTYVVDTSDLYLHAVFGGMTEELFFRAFVQQSVYDVFYEHVFKRKNKIGAAIISIGVGSISFGLAHINRYGLDPLAIGSPTVAGLSYGIFYFLSEGDVLETMIVHAINNWIAIDQQVKGTQLVGLSDNTNILVLLLLVLCLIVCVYIIIKMEKSRLSKRTKAQKLFMLICIVAVVFCINGAIFNNFLLYVVSMCLIIINVTLYTYIKRNLLTKIDIIMIIFNCIIMTIAIVVLMTELGMEIMLYRI